MRHGDLRQVLPLAEDVARPRRPGVVAVRAAGGVADETLHAGVHVGLVVVADVEHVVVALEHARQAAEADVGGAAVAAPATTRTSAACAALHLQRGGDAGGDRGGVAEQRMDPRHLPRGLRVRRREHLQAAGGVGGDQLAVGGRIAASTRSAPSASPQPWQARWPELMASCCACGSPARCAARAGAGGCRR